MEKSALGKESFRGNPVGYSDHYIPFSRRQTTTLQNSIPPISIVRFFEIKGRYSEQISFCPQYSAPLPISNVEEQKKHRRWEEGKQRRYRKGKGCNSRHMKNRILHKEIKIEKQGKRTNHKRAGGKCVPVLIPLPSSPDCLSQKSAVFLFIDNHKQRLSTPDGVFSSISSRSPSEQPVQAGTQVSASSFVLHKHAHSFPVFYHAGDKNTGIFGKRSKAIP